jgi:hypothetical protein
MTNASTVILCVFHLRIRNLSITQKEGQKLGESEKKLMPTILKKITKRGAS